MEAYSFSNRYNLGTIIKKASQPKGTLHTKILALTLSELQPAFLLWHLMLGLKPSLSSGHLLVFIYAFHSLLISDKFLQQYLPQREVIFFHHFFKTEKNQCLSYPSYKHCI